MSVYVRAEDLQGPTLRSRIYKFHGCAVRARNDPGNYREYLIARHAQIHHWVQDQRNAAMVGRLVDLIATKRTLMVGLSAQDANILSIFSRASVALGWQWPRDAPAYVFAEDELGFDQSGLLQFVYRDAYGPATRNAIHESALIRAYAKPLLSALVLHVWATKLQTLVQLAEYGALTNAVKHALQAGLITLRNLVAP